MNIITFCEMDESVISSDHKVEYYHSGCTGDASVAIIDINSIFDFEENKSNACAEKYFSLAIIDDESDFDAFKNFGIDTWIKRSDLSEINGLLTLIEKRL